MVNFNDTQDILARTLYGEADANNERDAIAIGHVILNRTRYPNWPDSIIEVCLQRLQFSCWNHNDPNRERIINAKGAWWDKCQSLARELIEGRIPDPTNRATHYYATWIKKPKWANRKKPSYKVPHKGGYYHLFYNDIDTPPPVTAEDKLNQDRPLATTRTAAGGAVATTGVAGGAANDLLQPVIEQISPFVGIHDYISYLFVGLTLAGIGWMLYARLQDRRKGLR